jgi:hypothetical protein
MHRSLAAAAVLVLGALAGCMQSGPAGPDLAAIQQQVAAAAAPALDLEHAVAGGHRIGGLHRGAHNVEVVGYSNGVDGTGDPNRIPARGAYNELAVTPRHVYLSRISGDGSFGGFSIISIEDPARPRVVGQFDAQGGSDIEVSADEELAFLSTQRNGVEQLVGGASRGPDPGAGLPRGVYVVDISDKRAPVLDTFVPLPTNGPHTLTYTQHPNGSEYLLACTYDLVTDPVSGAITGVVPATQRLIVYLVQRPPEDLPVPLRTTLLPVAQYQLTESAGPGKLVFPHDARVRATPEGQVLIELAYWDKGVRILDFTHPPAPVADAEQAPRLRELGAFTDFSPSALNSIHLAASMDERIAGRVITVAEPEIISAPSESGQITFLDTTEPGSIRKAGWWNLTSIKPDMAVRNLDFSPHNFDSFGTHVALAHNHAGLWILSVGPGELLERPKATGFYMPGTSPTGIERRDAPVDCPRTWGVVEQGGLLYVADECTGLHVVRYTGP